MACASCSLTDATWAMIIGGRRSMTPNARTLQNAYPSVLVVRADIQIILPSPQISKAPLSARGGCNDIGDNPEHGAKYP